MNTSTRIWTRPKMWDLTAPPHLALAGMALRWVHAGSRWRARIVYGLLIWQLIGFFVLLFAGPAFADPATTPPPSKANPADTSMFGWIDVKDSSGIPISQYFIAVDEGSAFSIIPGMGEDKKANIALAPILEMEYGLFKITCQLALWIIGYGLGFRWLDFVARPFDQLGAATESLTHSTAILTLALTVAGGVAAFAVLRGHLSKAAYQVGSAAVITTLLATLFAHPVAALVGHDGYLAKARDVGVSSAIGITHATGASAAGSETDINQLQTALADGFVRTPTQMLNFNASADKNGCKDVWNTGIRSGLRDKLKDDIAKCGAAGKKMKSAADHLSGDRLASAAVMGLLAAILLAFGCYLIGKIVLTTVIALSNAIMLPIVGAAGVVAGGLQGMAFKCLCNIGLALIKLPVTVVYAGAYAALLHSILKSSRDSHPVETLALATVSLIVAIFAFRRLSAGLANSGGSILNFLNRGGGAQDLPKPPLPTALRRGTAIAMQAGGAALGVPPSVTGLAIAGARQLRSKPHSTGPAAHAPDPQMAWWAQQHQWYGAQHQWWTTNNPTQVPAAPTSSPVASTPHPPPSTPVTQLLQLPGLHPAVANALGAMPQQMQPAGSLSYYQNPPARPPHNPAASAPPPHERARAANAASPPSPPTPPPAQRSRQRPTPAAATSAPRTPSKRVTDVINAR